MLTMSSEGEESSESSYEEDEYFPAGDHSYGLSLLANVTSIQPSYWNGYRWKQCMDGTNGTQISKTLNYQEITIVSWNVWFGLRNRVQRMQMLGKVISEQDPDFVCLQEVTSDIIAQIVQQKWARQYYLNDPEAQFLTRYGNVMFSKIKFHECIIKDMQSLMGRKMQLGSVLVKNSPKLHFGTFHLESDLKSAPTRASQLTDFKTALNGHDYTNFTSENELETIKDKFSDCWNTLYPNDAETNSMGKEEYEAQGIFEPKRKRLDRCFYTSDTIEPLSMTLLGTQPYAKGEYISDHYGILVKLRLKA